MRMKLDESLPCELADQLSKFGHDVDTSPSEGLEGSDDLTLWLAAQSAQRLLITQDLDFSDIRRFTPGTHQGVFLIRLKNPSRLNLIDRVLHVCQHHDADSWTGCFVVATDRKVRVRAPQR